MVRRSFLCSVMAGACLLAVVACSGGGGNSALPVTQGLRPGTPSPAPSSSSTPAGSTGVIGSSSTSPAPASSGIAPVIAGTIQAVATNQINILGPVSCGYVNVNYTSSTQINLNGYTMTPGVVVNVWGSGSCATSFTATELSLGTLSGGTSGAPPKATATPTPQPTSVPTSNPPVSSGSYSDQNYLGIMNGQEWPANFRPYCANAIPNSAAPCPWNDPLPDNPQQLYANSATIVANMGSQVQLEADFSLSGDYSHPVYLASPSDPVVTFTCTEYCGSVTQASFNVPSAARPAGGSDQHMGIIEPNGTEWDMWKTSYSGGSTGTAGILTQTSILGSGAVPGGGATSGGALAAGLIRFDELSRGLIPHALFATTTCVSGSVVYPGGSQANVCSSGTGPPVGARLQLTLTDAQINALNLLPWEKTIMHAMHDYGVYILDTSGGASPGPLDLRWESQDQFASYGQPYPGSSYPGLVSNITSFDSALNWSQNLRVVAACYAQETCSQ